MNADDTTMHVPQLDQLASFARTALDDPGALMLTSEHENARYIEARRFAQLSEKGDVDDWRSPETCYAIACLDEIIAAVNPADFNRETARRGLAVLGRHLEELRERMSEETTDTDEPDRDAYDAAEGALMAALDAVDHAIDHLTEGEDEC